MAIEVEISGTQPKKVEREYPYLGRGVEGSVVLFTSKDFGIYVAGKTYAIGHSYDNWNEDYFTPLSPSETITLRNK